MGKHAVHRCDICKNYETTNWGALMAHQAICRGRRRS